MSTQSSHRLASYASIAAAASVGAAANADLMIFDVGTTFTVSSPEPFAGGGPVTDLATFSAFLELEALGTTFNFGATQFRAIDSSGYFVNATIWGGGFVGGGQMATSKAGYGFLRQFDEGNAVGKGFSFTSGAPGGKAKAKNIPVDGGPKSTDVSKGLIDGQAYLGFAIGAEEDGFGYIPQNFGWLDITTGYDEEGNFFLTINRWAYETDVDVAASIPFSNPVPGAGGLLALAFGAAGIRRRRERVA